MNFPSEANFCSIILLKFVLNIIPFLNNVFIKSKAAMLLQFLITFDLSIEQFYTVFITTTNIFKHSYRNTHTHTKKTID